MGNVFGFGQSIREIVRDQRQLLYRSRRQLHREVERITDGLRSLDKQMAYHVKHNNRSGARHIARQLVRVRRQKDKLLEAETHMLGIEFRLQMVSTMDQVVASMEQAAECMRAVNQRRSRRDVSRVADDYGRADVMMEIKEEFIGDVMAEVIGSYSDEEGEIEALLDDVFESRQLVFPVAPTHLPQIEEQQERQFQFDEDDEEI